MISKTPLFVAALALGAMPAFANDTTAQLGTGGLVFVTNENIEMASEDLSISTEEVKVVYQFKNISDEDQHILVAFPMPDITGSGDFMVGVPTDDPENIFGFQTTFDGKPVKAQLHRYVFNNNIEYTDLLTGLGVPLTPYGETVEALNALDPADQKKLSDLGLVLPMQWSDGSDDAYQTDYIPVWTLRSTYSWEATFPAKSTSTVVHTYKPSVGGTVAVTFAGTEDYQIEQYKEYKDKYCLDDAFMSAVKKTAQKQDGYTDYPFYETWLSYIWSTGANWGGPIGKFTLTVDKGSTDNLVSFCGENVKKIGPTTFQMTEEDFYPPWNRELEILILTKREPYSE